MEQYLIDTNVISDYFSSSLSSRGLQFIDVVVDAIPNISVITQIELLCWKTEAGLEQQVKDFISDSTIVGISPEVIEHCVRLRREKKIKTPDAIIAATALAYNYTIITNDEKDFSKIQELKIVNPHKL